MSLNGIIKRDIEDSATSYLLEHAQESWHPVSKPPTKEDGNEVGEVIVFQLGEGSLCRVFHWSRVSREHCGWRSKWARIRDVVLLPEKLDG